MAISLPPPKGRSRLTSPSPARPSVERPAPSSGAVGQPETKGSTASTPPSAAEGLRGSRWGGVALGLGLVGSLGLILRVCVGPDGAVPATTPSATDTSREALRPSASTWGGRCKAASAGSELGQGFLLGEAPRPPKGEASPDPGAQGGPDAAPAEVDEEGVNAPFAVEVGRGSRWDGGFAVGALHDGEGGTVASLVTVDREGGQGRVTRLARSRGDMDPPVAVGRGASVLVGMLEPNAGGRALRIARVRGAEVGWGPEFAQGRDDSLAFDLAVTTTSPSALAAWDEYHPEEHRSEVLVAGFDADTLQGTRRAHPVSLPQTDADSPRLVPRPGGYWLAYLAHGPAAAPPRVGREGHHDSAKTASPTQDNPGEEESDRGETVGTSWLEVMLLDEQGLAQANPRRVTPSQGNVLAYDLEPSQDGSLLLAWRDDDGPSGASGGAVSLVLVQAGSVGEPQLIAEDGVGIGVPDLLPGWLAITSLRGARRLAPISPTGALVGLLAPEKAIGPGELLGADGDRLLVATPAGRALRLGVVSCDPQASPPPSPSGTVTQ